MVTVTKLFLINLKILPDTQDKTFFYNHARMKLLRE